MMLNKLSLNTIGLNRIGLNRIGKPSRGSSGRPYIDPEVLASLKAVCICYGKSNDDPDRAIVKNLVDPDNPFIISNAAYKLNSGYGLYGMDFLEWKSNSGMSFTSTKLTSTKPNLSGGWLTFRNVSGLILETKVKVSGAPREFGFIANNNGTDDKFSVTINNGVYTIPEFTLSSASGFYINNNSGDWSNLVIEQIPQFEGAFVTDGVDDLITSTKTVQEMGITDEITVVSMIGQLSTPNVNNYTNTIRNQLGTTGSYNKVEVSAIDKTGIYGYSFDSSLRCSIINDILGDKQDYSVSTATQVENISAKYLVQGWIATDGIPRELSSVAWYWTVIANKVLTTDQINQVIAYYNLDRCVEPTVWYDVQKQGLSNDTPDSDWYLKDYSGNGYDMTLYNYAKTPESGINEDGGLQSDGVDDYGKVTGLPIYKDYTVVADYVRTFAKENVQDAPILSKSQVAGDGAFLFNYLNVNSVISSYSFGTNNVLTNVSDSERKIYYQSKYVNGGKSINSGTGTDYDSMWLGTYRDDSQIFFTGAIYSLMTFPYSMSEFLIERQLKKHKLGTLYPDMVEWRPIYTSNVNDYTITKATYFDETGQHDLALGNHYPIGTRFRIYVKPSGAVDEVTSIKVNGVELTYDYIDSNYGYAFNGTLSSKSPQKIDITIDEYIRYEDIVQPYPAVVSLLVNGAYVKWGDKLKVGDKFKYLGGTNLLPNLYSKVAGITFNGGEARYGDYYTIEKVMNFIPTVKTWNGSSYEPKVILSPERLNIPNSSLKILGYIPDLSGHGNHGVIHNSAYAEGSGVNADGSYQLDGVDDFITIPTTVGGKQVIMKVIWDDVIADAILYDQRGYPNEFAIYNADNDNSGNPVTAYQARNNGKTYIDGILNSNIKASELKNVNHIITITNELSSGANNTFPIIGSNKVNDAYFTKMALYDFMLFDEISTDEEILTLNKYVGIEGNTDD